MEKAVAPVFQGSAFHGTEAVVVVRSVISFAVFENCVTLSSLIPLILNGTVAVETPLDVNIISAESITAPWGTLRF